MGMGAQVGATVPVSVDLALSLVRTLNTIQVVMKGYTGPNFTGPWASQKDMFLDPKHGIVSQAGSFGPDSSVYAWMSCVNFYSNNVLPGWVLDFAIVQGCATQKFHLQRFSTQCNIVTS
jgi:hypothetical protein